MGPRVFGIGIDSEKSLMIMAAIFLALASFAVALVRRGRFGRRLIALRDSEAAYAMLGGNLLVSKVSVFALSAGMAGLGGALYAMQQQAITAIQFSFEAGLPFFLIAVVGGLASVGAGLFAGFAVGGSFTALVQVLPWADNLAAILPGLAGIGLGRNPDGVVPRIRQDWTPVLRHRAVLAAGIGVSALLWGLRLAGVISGWALFWGAVVIAGLVRINASARTTAGGSGSEAQPAPVPVEWWGLRRPWRADDEEVLDRAVARG